VTLPITTVTGPLLQQRPDWGYRPQQYSPLILRRRDRLVSIFNHESAATHGYSPLDFNPRPIDPDNPTIRGRFHSTKADEFAYKYFARLGRSDDERLAMWEIINYEDIGFDAIGRMIVPSSIITKYSFLRARPRRNLHLAQLRNQNDGVAFFADLRALRGEDFSVTREWARYIRDRFRKVEGIMYVSSAYGDSAGGGYAVVLFESLPHVTETNRIRARMIQQVGKIIGLGTDAGRKRAAKAMRDIRWTVL
jgi:hypothetical protein